MSAPAAASGFTLLAVARADARVPPDLRRVAVGGLAAVGVDRGVDEAERLALLRDLMAAAAIAPLRERIGDDRAALAAFLAMRRSALLAAVRKVGGCVEIVATTRRRRRAADPVAAALDLAAAARPFTRDVAIRGDGPGEAQAIVLVLADRGAAAQGALQAAAEAHGASVAAPAPAFHFAALAAFGAGWRPGSSELAVGPHR